MKTNSLPFASNACEASLQVIPELSLSPEQLGNTLDNYWQNIRINNHGRFSVCTVGDLARELQCLIACVCHLLDELVYSKAYL